MAKSYLISDGYKGQIDDVISRLGNQPEGSVQRIQTRFESMPSDSTVFRICTFTGAWSKNAGKVVTYKFQSATPNTVLAFNVFVGITATTGGNCAIAREGTSWFLIQAECSQ